MINTTLYSRNACEKDFMKKNIFGKIAVILLVVAMLTVSFVFVGCNDGNGDDFTPDRHYFLGKAKNVIIMIGDGMGQEHLESVKAYYDLDSLYMETLTTFKGEQTTYCRDNAITDSAAAATALSCGVKADKGSIAVVDGMDIPNMSEFATGNSMDVGIIATEVVTGATPAGFTAHADSRKSSSEIYLSQLNSDVDIFITPYDTSFYNTKRDQAIVDAGFTHVKSFADMTPNQYSQEKIFATVSGFDPYGSDKETYPTLAEASLYGINYLDQKSDNGFFMMIEGSLIDKKSHSNQFVDMAKEVRGFDEAVKAVLEWAAADGETLVIVTADHETGGLEYNSGDTFGNNLFTSDDHTADNVFFFTFGLDAEDVTYINQSATTTSLAVIDNIVINNIMRDYISNYRFAR